MYLPRVNTRGPTRPCKYALDQYLDLRLKLWDSQRDCLDLPGAAVTLTTTGISSQSTANPIGIWNELFKSKGGYLHEPISISFFFHFLTEFLLAVPYNNSLKKTPINVQSTFLSFFLPFFLFLGGASYEVMGINEDCYVMGHYSIKSISSRKRLAGGVWEI